jgi:hypothetical protein
MPKCLVTSSYWARTLSKNETLGKGLGVGWFEGDEDCPLPNSAVMMMKYFFGLRVLSSPINQKLSAMAVQEGEATS